MSESGGGQAKGRGEGWQMMGMMRMRGGVEERRRENKKKRGEMNKAGR